MSGGNQNKGGWGQGASDTPAARLRRLFPHYAALQKRAKLRAARFGYDFVAGGAGDGAPNVQHNRDAMDAVRIIPRYGVDLAGLTTKTTIFGRDYAMPLGVAPMGNTGLVWPRADAYLAAAAQKARVPYVSSTVANVGMEEMARLAPDSFWFQLYGLPGEDHKYSFDIVRRAEAAGAHVLILTLDVPMRQKRVQDIRNGLVVPFRFRPRTILDIARAPLWALETLRRGQPRFPNVERYCGGPGASNADLASFVYNNMTSGLTWEVIARIREIWPRALVVKGIQHPEDAAKAVAIGCDGILVSNHGGRQFDAAPSSIDCVPAVRAAVGNRAAVLLDGSIRSGLDVLRGLAAGAEFCFAGRAFLWSVAALGEPGGDHAMAAFAEETRGVFGQAGVRNVAEAMQAPVLHPNAVEWPPVRGNSARHAD